MSKEQIPFVSEPGEIYIGQIKKTKTRKPRNAESITAGALSLSLAERVELCKKLKESIQHEVEKAQEQAKVAADISKNL